VRIIQHPCIRVQAGAVAALLYVLAPLPRLRAVGRGRHAT